MLHEPIEVPEAQLFPELRASREQASQRSLDCAWDTTSTHIQVELAVVPSLVLSSQLCVFVTLVDEEVVGEDVEGDSRQIDLVQASCLVGAVADKPLVTTVQECRQLKPPSTDEKRM